VAGLVLKYSYFCMESYGQVSVENLAHSYNYYMAASLRRLQHL